MKYIFVTGGVVSSLGKGLAAASIGTLLEHRHLKVQLQKFDPYLNVDPGTMSPYQHGEVYVLDDGAETDLDLGHYERFTNCTLSQLNSLSSGQVFENVIRKERKEIGGTVGDIEGHLFLEALRQFSQEVGRENVCFIHVTLLPLVRAAGEIKTKPTQQSVAKLREIGIQPDIIICRTEHELDDDNKKKIAMFCNVPPTNVVAFRDVEHTIYECPLDLRKDRIDRLVSDTLGLESDTPDLTPWQGFVDRIVNPSHKIRIGIVGKYIELQDAYKSIYESLTIAGAAHDTKIKLVKIDAEKIEKEGPSAINKKIDGILIPGGFGERGVEGKIEAARYARENGIPYFGICLGMQIATIEFARNVCGLEGANSTEFKKDATHPVICLQEEQQGVTDMGGSMRLGNCRSVLFAGTKSAALYDEADHINERHRVSEKEGLVEIIENPEHPYFVAAQFHPEFKSKPNKPHPLFSGFVKAALERRNS